MMDTTDLKDLFLDGPDGLDVELRLDPTPRKPKRWRRHYVQFPWSWIERLRKAKRISTYRLALLLVYEHWRTGGQPVLLSNVLVAAEGLNRRSKWNALVELADLELIRIERRRNKAPRVILKHLAGAKT